MVKSENASIEVDETFSPFHLSAFSLLMHQFVTVNPS